MTITRMNVSGLVLVTPVAHADGRGLFVEAYNRRAFADAGVDLTVVQHNQSNSKKNVIRGLHFQWNKPLGKLMRVVCGRAFTVAVDIRKNSETRGKFDTVELSGENHKALWAPFGFATGFCALEDDTIVEYYYSAYYNKSGESNIRWDDRDIAIPWPIVNPIISQRDARAQSFAEWLRRPESDHIE